ncbi:MULTISPECIES: hypothetical protein [unclassified Pseudomonas]|uniref:hypothetical protein n=1 Tax=unclassified Pseudomonas TaxID=196821 RepID=UPI00111BDE86|nr:MULTISPECIES: hypothetical protein [unclassified Pseudomonas]
MANNLNGNYDGGSGNIYRLVIDSHDESKGRFSGYFHNTQNDKWEKVNGGFSFYSDGRDETVLQVSTSVGSWRWEADYVNGSPSFAKWYAKLNGTETTEFYRESQTPKIPTIAELKYGD